jgi:hypothetical protein
MLPIFPQIFVISQSPVAALTWIGPEPTTVVADYPVTVPSGSVSKIVIGESMRESTLMKQSDAPEYRGRYQQPSPYKMCYVTDERLAGQWLRYRDISSTPPDDCFAAVLNLTCLRVHSYSAYQRIRKF